MLETRDRPTDLESVDRRSTGVAGASNAYIYGLGEFLRDLWRRKWILAALTLGCGAIGCAFGAFSAQEYTASVLVAPVLGNESAGGLSGLSSLAGGFGGLASLAGISLPGKQEDDEAVAVLESDLLAREFIKKNSLLPVLFARQWDPARNAWRTSDRAKVPTLWKGSRYFGKEVRMVKQDQKSGLYLLSIRWKDPRLAAGWANGLVKMTNDLLRTQAIDEADRNIAYLSDQAGKVTAVSVRQVLYTLLEHEIDREMIARGREEYALKVIDPAYPPEKSSSLSILALGVIGLCIGALVSVLFVFVRGVLSG